MGKKVGIFYRDLAGKLTMLRVECDKCGRSGRYSVERLAREEPDGTVGNLLERLTADCPRSYANAGLTNIYDLCRAHCPDLPKVV